MFRSVVEENIVLNGQSAIIWTPCKNDSQEKRLKSAHGSSLQFISEWNEAEDSFNYLLR